MDTTTIEAVDQGDFKAFKQIFDNYLPKMRPVCLRYMAPEEADEVLVASFNRIFHHLKQTKFEGSLEGWVRKIVVQTALDFQKKKKSPFQFLHTELLDDRDVPEESPSLLYEFDQSQLRGIISNLPEGYRTVFCLYVFDDFSHKEIGEMLGITEGTAKSLYLNARKMIIGILRQLKKEENSYVFSQVLNES